MNLWEGDAEFFIVPPTCSSYTIPPPELAFDILGGKFVSFALQMARFTMHRKFSKS